MPAITFKCTAAQKDELEARSNGNVSQYIKDVLFGHMSREDELAHLVEMVERIGNTAPAEGESPRASGLDLATQGMLIEMLLLMRTAVKPNAQREAQAEVDRLGLPVWQSKS